MYIDKAAGGRPGDDNKDDMTGLEEHVYCKKNRHPPVHSDTSCDPQKGTDICSGGQFQEALPDNQRRDWEQGPDQLIFSSSQGKSQGKVMTHL